MSKYNIGMEMVDFQNHDFFKNLTYHFSELKKKTPNELEKKDVTIPLAKEILSFTGLTFNIILDEFGPLVLIPKVTKSSILLNDYQKSVIPNSTGKRLVEEADGIITGKVDIATGKVSGCFTKIEHEIHLPALMILDDRFSAEEIAAATLHEIGHIFTYYEYITRTVTTNQVLEGVSRELAATNNPKEIEAVIVSARKSLKLTDLDVEKLTKSNDKRIVEMVILTKAIEANKSQLGSDIYDLNSWEMLADNYAARMGAGRHLVTALNKIQDGNISYRSTSHYLFLEAAKILSLMGGILGYAAPASSVLGAFMPFGLIAFMILFTMDLNSEAYDRPGVRIQRIKNQIVMRLRDKNIPKQEREDLNEDLKIIEESMKNINDRLQWITKVTSFIIPSIRNRYKQERIQQELEYLVANDLFTLFQDIKRS